MPAIDRFIDGLLSAVSNVLKEPATAFVELETVDNDGTSFVASDGSLATVLRINGSARMVGAKEYQETVAGLTKMLDSAFKESGHALQIYWIRDPEAAPALVSAALEGARIQAEQLQMNFTDLLDEKVREISKYVSHEAVYFVCWTHPSVLSPIESKSAMTQQRKDNEAYAGLNFTDAQNPRRLVSALRNRHQALCSSLKSTLGDFGLLTDVLEAHEAANAIRSCVDPQWTTREWRAVLPGDKIPVRFPVRHEEISAVWLPPLASQLWPRDAKTIDGRFVQIGDRVHAPMYIDIPPIRIEEFQQLIQRTIGLNAKMPWSVSFLLTGNGLRKHHLKSTIAAVMAVMGQNNPFIRDSIRDLQSYAQEGAVVGFQVCFNTWSDAGKMEQLRQRASQLSQAFINWGGAETREITGDPVEGFTSSSLALTYKSVATEAAAPLSDVVHMLPITRPASPWRTGAELFTSPDGKLMPFQPGSSLQTTWNALYTGGPGSGKSVQMSKQHLAGVLAPQPGVTKVPYTSIIDIGPSSQGLASLLKNALPPSLQHYVNHYRLRNTEDYCVNPLDLQLGMDYPLPEERSFLVNLITMLVTPAETGAPYEATAELVGTCIDWMYNEKKDNERGNPMEYHPGVDDKVDAALTVAGVTVTPKMTWYAVRDALYRAGMTLEATMAQRHAVPTISDMTSACISSQITDTYGHKYAIGGGGETLPQAVSRMIQSATREYKILSGPTRFDIGESRVTIFDLDEVAKGGGPAGQKQIAVMYGLSMYLLTRNFTLTQDNLRDIPEEYRRYHFPRVQAVSKELKTLCCDEFHRTGIGFSSTLRDRIKIFFREGRKWNIQVMLGSQRIQDFDEEMVAMATAIYIMERPDESLVQEYAQQFGLSPTEQQALRTGVRAPGPGGGTFFVRMKTRSGYYNQLLRNPAGPLELWALSTHAEDKVIREQVYTSLGPSEGRLALAMSYPNGSAKPEVESRKEQMTKMGKSLTDEGADDDLFRVMATEVIESYQKRKIDQMRRDMAEQELRNAA